jgi:uncharacterized membrane protein
MSVSGGGITMSDTDEVRSPGINEETRLGRTTEQQSEINLDAAMEQHELAAGGSSQADAGIQWLPLVGGGLLAGYGLSRGSFSGLLLAAAGGGIAYYGMTGQMPSLGAPAPDGERSVRVEEAVTINRPIDAVYDEWRDISRLPQRMSHLESVTDLGGGRSHWVAKAPLGRTVEWDAELLHDAENRVISWRSLDGADVPNVGAVHFHEAPGGRGTEVRVRIEYSPPAGQIGASVAKLFGEEPSGQVSSDLRRFKQFMETGEVATTNGQSRGTVGSVIDTITDKARQATDAIS